MILPDQPGFALGGNFYRFLFIALLAGITVFTGPAWATSITITNFSFETGSTPCNTGWTCNPGFVGGEDTGTSTRFPIPNGTSPGSPGQFVPDGVQYAFFQRDKTSQSLTQNTAATFVAGQIYTLSAWAGLRHDQANTWPIDAIIELLAGGTQVAFQSVGNPGFGKWAETTLSYTATAADNGKTIGVGLVGSTPLNSQIAWDDVTLDAAPEPSTLLLLAMGFGALGLARRKSKGQV